jgi:hypothetical protein
VRGPDLTVRHGHISKQGPAWLRRVMNQAAQTARRSPEFSATYAAIARRRGKKIATIAISQAADPRLAPARHRPGTAPGGTRCQHGHRSRPQTGRVTKPRVSSPFGMSRRQRRARSSD